MPFQDLPSPAERARRPRRRGRSHKPPYQEPLRHGRKPKRGRDLDDGGVPVEPDRPRNLSGGAAAALEFDD